MGVGEPWGADAREVGPVVDAEPNRGPAVTAAWKAGHGPRSERTVGDQSTSGAAGSEGVRRAAAYR